MQDNIENEKGHVTTYMLYSQLSPSFTTRMLSSNEKSTVKILLVHSYHSERSWHCSVTSATLKCV